jgi:hypothetical protein
LKIPRVAAACAGLTSIILEACPAQPVTSPIVLLLLIRHRAISATSALIVTKGSGDMLFPVGLMLLGCGLALLLVETLTIFYILCIVGLVLMLLDVLAGVP